MVVEYLNTKYSNEGFEDDNGYRVYSCKVIEADENCKNGDEIIITGYNIPKAPMLRYIVDGVWKDSKYGVQFSVTSYEEFIMPTYRGIVGYLTSGIIKGVTPPIAERIYRAFRNETITILDTDVNRLKEVPGIGDNLVDSIIESYQYDRILKKVLVKYKEIGLTQKKLVRLVSTYGRNLEDSLNKNPYILTECGIPFVKVNAFCRKKGFENTIGKAEAVILEAIKSGEGENGNTYVKDSVYVKKVATYSKKYGVTKEQLSKAEDALREDGKIIYLNNGVSRQIPYSVESDIAKELFRIVSNFKPCCDIDIDAEIDNSEERLKCSLHINQREAVKQALLNGVLLITGGPGTGKTTVVKVMRDILENVLHKDVLFIAPTGRAAARMKESSGYAAFTAHKILKINDENILDRQPFSIEEETMVCDETSMVDIYVARRILQSVPSGHQVIFLGDVEQLPSVGPGAVFKDMMDSGYVPTVCLTKVFRQSSNSNIYLNCRKIVKGNLSLEYGEDFVLLYAYEQEEAAAIMADMFVREVDEFGLPEVCCLTPLRKKTETGAYRMNKRIQRLINPKAPDKDELYYSPTDTIYRLGDRVMSTQNTEKTCNGDLGYIVKIEHEQVTVRYSECSVTYDYDDLENLPLAYCMTIHKSQGSGATSSRMKSARTVA